MLLKIKNLLPRLRQYSQTLDKIELLVEHPWVLIDDEGNQQKYIFRRGGKLILSFNGRVSFGTWEYLPSARSLLIDLDKGTILLNHDFVDPAVMALKMDGNKDMPFVLANENLIPDMDVVRYLESVLQRNAEPFVIPGRPKFLPQHEPKYFRTYNSNKGKIQVKQIFKWDISVGDLVFQNEKAAPDGHYRLSWFDRFVVRDGRIIKTN